ncbi:thiamine ABC transporter substrate binding subunit [Mesobaculum littorinae]|uniref:Thiamine-binding periplasmic protein n=1 Tax=Mesobaculum littorinae TaxID=2486419 RepID=A0A438AF68_9RHOB|nr:thiamine ABC transporter substrate binding subunit [Mesobaculum littorinae]RVV97361.1 thiamine ABC transporter substrate binding subunit [Mesobaculum littorinae]
MRRTPLAIFAALTALPALHAAAQETPVLTVYTYDSFDTEWGPGPRIEPAFEERCGCDLQFVGAGDGAALLARLRLEGGNTDADVVLGLDTALTAAARDTGLFAPHGIEVPPLDLPVDWQDDTFVPFDWGYFAFVHARDFDPPANFRDLADSEAQVVIQDPRSSTPGLGLLMWVKAAYGDAAPEIWEGLADNIVTVTKGWSEAYGLFLDGEADMVLSYTTSPAYHVAAEADDTKTAAPFDEGHYLQVEVAARLAGSDQPELARDFLDFMLTAPFQTAIPETNWMYPAVTPEAGLPAAYDGLIRPGTALLLSPDEARAIRDTALDEWLTALSR